LTLAIVMGIPIILLTTCFKSYGIKIVMTIIIMIRTRLHVDGDDDDDELYNLVYSGCHATMKYVIKHIDKQPCEKFEEIRYG
jgi:hypothetical protein